MARTAVLGRLTWRLGTVTALRDETPTVRTIVLDVPEWPGHRAGQHVDVRLTAEDGYQAERSYSIASAPEQEPLELTVERLDDGEVSPYLVDELREGDQLELRGPIGGYFVWEAAQHAESPLLLVGGGSGVVPLMCMLRHRAAAGADVPARSPHLGAVARRGDLPRRARAARGRRRRSRGDDTLTRSAPPAWTGYRRRVDAAMLDEVAWPAPRRPRIYVCGPTPLVEAVATDLVRLGHEPGRVKTERFGPTGG